MARYTAPLVKLAMVSIPKRVSEVLWLGLAGNSPTDGKFQSLKGFQRFCGKLLIIYQGLFYCFNP